MNGYILVGGRSARMGRSKSELFLDRMIAAAMPVFSELLAVHRPDGEPLPLRTVLEQPHEGEGPIFGLETALHDARGKCFILGVDYPLVTPELLAWLADEFERSDAKALVPYWDGQPQPLCAGYDASLLPLIEQRIAEQKFDLRGLVEAAGAATISEDEIRARFAGEPLKNVNTPADLEEAMRLYGS